MNKKLEKFKKQWRTADEDGGFMNNDHRGILLYKVLEFIDKNFIAKSEVEEVKQKIENLERGGQGNEYEDLARENAIMECLEIIKDKLL